jgi:uncharacterized sporulation protein YeaH/YhbH (DUF444 family)
MTETETMEAKGTAIALPEASALAAMFKADNGLDDLINRIADQAAVEAAGLDPKIAADRKALRSIAYRVAQTKAEIERRAKEALMEHASVDEATTIVKAVMAGLIPNVSITY